MKCILTTYLLENSKYLSLSCDGWSLTKPKVGMEVFFVNSFRENSFRSYLFDIYSYESTTAEALQTTANQIKSKLGNKTSFITTDGGRNNIAAFKQEHAICFCHAINTVINHIVNKPKPHKKNPLKYGLEFKEREVLYNHFFTIHKYCVKIRGQYWKDFSKWVSEYQSVNTDFPGTIPIPETICCTRWIGVSTYMRWLLKYGLLLYRFAFANKLCSQFPGIRNLLDVLEETAWLVFLLEHCMSLLMVSDKPTLHLVIPILEGLKTILTTEPCSGFITAEALAMRKLILYELNEGCLCINKKEYEKYREYCYVALYLFPEADNLVNTVDKYNILTMAESICEKYYNQLSSEKQEFKDLKCNKWATFKVNIRERDGVCINSYENFLDYLRPAKTRLVFHGVPNIITLFLSKKEEKENGKKGMTKKQLKMYRRDKAGNARQYLNTSKEKVLNNIAKENEVVIMNVENQEYEIDEENGEDDEMDDDVEVIDVIDDLIEYNTDISSENNAPKNANSDICDLTVDINDNNPINLKDIPIVHWNVTRNRDSKENIVCKETICH